MKKLIKTPMLQLYIFKFILRVCIFISVFFVYVTNKDLLCRLVNTPIWIGVTPLHGLWLFFMVMMIMHLFPKGKHSMALLKREENPYKEQENYSKLELFEFVRAQNVRAWMVMLVWLSINAVIGILYLCNILDVADLLMITVFFFLCDYICILFFCPFQTYIMKNKCCVNCRIYDWGHFMMFTPMLFVRNFFSWSLFFTSCIVLIHWELMYAKYPERFWSGSNQTLQCANCKDKTCQMKKNS